MSLFLIAHLVAGGISVYMAYFCLFSIIAHIVIYRMYKGKVKEDRGRDIKEEEKEEEEKGPELTASRGSIKTPGKPPCTTGTQGSAQASTPGFATKGTNAAQDSTIVPPDDLNIKDK